VRYRGSHRLGRRLCDHCRLLPIEYAPARRLHSGYDSLQPRPGDYAVLVGWSRRLTGQPGYWRSMLFPLAPIAGLVLAVVFVVADLHDADAGRPSRLILGAMIAAGLLWHRFVLRRRGWAPRVELMAPASTI
jgi:hypothetical protein